MAFVISKGEGRFVVMAEYVIERHDSNADGGSRLPVICYGIIEAESHREAVAIAYERHVRNRCQWIEATRIDKCRAAKVRAARRATVGGF